MKLSTLARASALAAAALGSAALFAQEPNLESLEGRAGYSIGVNIGMNLQSQGIAGNVDTQALLAGVADGLNGELKLSEEQLVQAITELSAIMETQAREEMAQHTQANQDFLTENAKNDGVTTTDSGLQYMVLEEGDDSGAASPTAADSVSVHYHGTLIDGTVFDSSMERGQPASFPLGSVIPGWTEGLQLMQVGDKYRFFIPSNLAYGESGAPGAIPPNSTLIFDVELLNIGGSAQ